MSDTGIELVDEFDEAEQVIEVPEPEPEPVIVFQISVDANDVINGAMQTNIAVEGYIAVSREVYQEAVPLIGKARYVDGAIVLLPAPPPPPIVLPAEVLFFERMTDDEFDDLDASVRAGETARVYRGWSSATSFTEGTDMWALLVKHLNLVVTPERRAELLAA